MTEVNEAERRLILELTAFSGDFIAALVVSLRLLNEHGCDDSMYREFALIKGLFGLLIGTLTNDEPGSADTESAIELCRILRPMFVDPNNVRPEAICSALATL